MLYGCLPPFPLNPSLRRTGGATFSMPGLLKALQKSSWLPPRALFEAFSDMGFAKALPGRLLDMMDGTKVGVDN